MKQFTREISSLHDNAHSTRSTLQSFISPLDSHFQCGKEVKRKRFNEIAIKAHKFLFTSHDSWVLLFTWGAHKIKEGRTAEGEYFFVNRDFVNCMFRLTNNGGWRSEGRGRKLRECLWMFTNFSKVKALMCFNEFKHHWSILEGRTTRSKNYCSKKHKKNI